MSLDDAMRTRLGRRAQLLAASSVGYNVVEAVVSIGAGVMAGSTALVGFGLDSIVELPPGQPDCGNEGTLCLSSARGTGLRLMALAFFALAGYVIVESLRGLTGGHVPDQSTVGIALAAVSLAVMPF